MEMGGEQLEMEIYDVKIDLGDIHSYDSFSNSEGNIPMCENEPFYLKGEDHGITNRIAYRSSHTHHRIAIMVLHRQHLLHPALNFYFKS